MVKWDFRDVSTGLQTIRQFLLGRKFVFHHRFLPVISPRSIPPPDIPRGPEYKYSDQWYGNRDLLNSVKPPVVAPVLARGFKSTKPNPCYPKTPSTGPSVKFPSELPTPGCVWWFDAHCYYKEETRSPCGRPSKLPTVPPPSSTCPCPPPENERPVVKVKSEDKDPCKEEPPCKLEPCKVEKVIPQRPPEICDPCKVDDPKKKC